MRAAPNLGNLDRVIRLLIAIVLIALYFLGLVPKTIGIILAMIAGILVSTAYLSFCPIWGMLRISTKKKNKSS